LLAGATASVWIVCCLHLRRASPAAYALYAYYQSHFLIDPAPWTRTIALLPTPQPLPFRLSSSASLALCLPLCLPLLHLALTRVQNICRQQNPYGRSLFVHEGSAFLALFLLCGPSSTYVALQACVAVRLGTPLLAGALRVPGPQPKSERVSLCTHMLVHGAASMCMALQARLCFCAPVLVHVFEDFVVSCCSCVLTDTCPRDLATWLHSRSCGRTPGHVVALQVMWLHSRSCGCTPGHVVALQVMWSLSRSCGCTPGHVVALQVMWLHSRSCGTHCSVHSTLS